jgi:hypothetical protein
VFGLSERIGRDTRPLTQLETYVLSSSLAFLDAYVRDMPDALAWLTSGDIERWSGGEASIASK